MAISFVASRRSPTSYPSSSNNTSTCAISKPTGTTEGDVMVVFLESGGAATFSYPSGWTEISRYQNTSANMTSGIAYRVAGSSEPSSYSFGDSQGGITPLCGMLLTYRGVDNDAPIDVHAEANGGTSPSTSASAPSATSTVDGWFVWFRAGKISTSNPSENSFNVSSGTARQATSNRGASTEYFVQSADSGNFLTAGAHGGADFSRSGSGSFSGSLERTIVLKQGAPPPNGDASLSLGGVTVATSGEVHDDATLSASLGGVSVAFTATHYPPAVGAFAMAVGGVTGAFAASGVGGPLTLPLAAATVGVAGSVNPIGSMPFALAPLVVELVAETRAFGSNVILIEPEKRAFRITQYEMTPIYKSDVAFEPLASPFEMTLGVIGQAFTAETTSGTAALNLGGIAQDFDAQIVWGDFDGVGLSPVSVSATGALVGGPLAWQLPGLSVEFGGFKENPGTLAVELGAVSMLWSDSPAGPFAASLGGVSAAFAGGIVDGDFDGIQLGGVTADFDGTITTEDIMKYAVDVGDGSATTYTVTHGAGTRDVVVSVFDNSTYEEVVPLTVHATMNTVTVQFASAPSTNAYRVVVIWSSV